MALLAPSLNDHVRFARRTDVRDVVMILVDSLREHGFPVSKRDTKAELVDFGGGTNLRVDHLVAVSAGKVCGFLVMKPGAGLLEGEIEKLFVAQKRRGDGHGLRLLDEAYAIARFRGYRTLRLHSAEQFEHARAWYQRQGWKQTPGAQPDWFEREVPAVEWLRA